ncbi:MAG: nitroreductase [Gemella sp.]|nr:nitroreductase [Gemella sp.]
MDFKSLINTRKSTRHFTDRTIDKETLKEIVADAQKTPSWVNSQPWKVYIASGKVLDSIKKIYLEKNVAEIPANPDFKFVDKADWPVFTRDNMTNFNKPYPYGFRQAQWNLFNAPHIAYITIPKGSPEWAIHDSGMFSQTLMLAAGAKGIDSMIAYNIVKYPDVLKEELAIPDDEIIAVGIALGYEEKNHPLNKGNQERNSLDNVLTFMD